MFLSCHGYAQIIAWVCSNHISGILLAYPGYDGDYVTSYSIFLLPKISILPCSLSSNGPTDLICEVIIACSIILPPLFWIFILESLKAVLSQVDIIFIFYFLFHSLC